MKIKTTIIAALFMLALISCRSRLQPTLYEILDSGKRELVRNDTYYQTGFELNDDYARSAVRPGSGIVMVTSQSAKNTEKDEVSTGLIKAVGEIEYRLYVYLPFINQDDSLDISGKSICRLIGFYEIADSLKHFSCREGFIKVDSVKSSRFNAFLSGKFFNRHNDSLLFEGFLKAEQKK